MDYQFQEKKVVPFPIMKEWIYKIMLEYGMQKEDAQVVADHLVVADARGVYSHGAMRVPIYCKRFEQGGTSPTAQPIVVRKNQASALVDGKNSMGMVASKFGMDLAIAMAKQAGSATVSVMGSNHLGTCAYWAEMAANQDMIGFCWTINYVNIMAPWGGVSPQLGNNPFAIAAPCLTKPNIVYDIATSVVARGKIVMAMKTNSPIPESWALDRNGNPTMNAEEGYRGTVRPIGDYKGSGLTFMNAVISALLPGAFFGDQITDLYERPADIQNTGHLFQVIDIASISDVQDFKKRMDDAVEYIKNGQKADGVKEIFVPGEIEAKNLERSKKEGIVYPIEVIQDLRSLSKKLQIESLA